MGYPTIWPGPVKSDVPSAVAFEDLYTALRQQVICGEDVCPLGVSAQGDDRRMFQQKKNVTDASFFAQFDQLLLQTQARGVVDRAELEDGDQDRFATDRRDKHGS